MCVAFGGAAATAQMSSDTIRKQKTLMEARSFLFEKKSGREDVGNPLKSIKMMYQVVVSIFFVALLLYIYINKYYILFFVFIFIFTPESLREDSRLDMYHSPP